MNEVLEKTCTRALGRYLECAGGKDNNATIIQKLVDEFFPDESLTMRLTIAGFAAGIGAGSIRCIQLATACPKCGGYHE